MRKVRQLPKENLCARPNELKYVYTLIIFCTLTAAASAQNYIGVGLHLTPPVRFDFTRSQNVTVKPRAGIGGSLTYKREWALKKNGSWYAEAGLALQGLRYYQVSYTGDSTTIWSDWTTQHAGFPSILAGAGRSWAIKNAKNKVSVGGELLLLIAQDLDSVYSYDFSLLNQPDGDAVFPVFPRLNVGYTRELTFFRRISGQLQFYAALSFQDITKGKQYILDRETNMSKVGRYRVNNSAFGVKLFTSLNKKENKKRTDVASIENLVLATSERKRKLRISLNSQLFRAPTTVYHIPQVDSFSVSGRQIMLPQIGLMAEIPHQKNDLWSTVIGLGLGKRAATLVFKADKDFPATNQAINFEQSVDIGHYAIANVGLSRKHALKSTVLSHTLTTSAVVPLEKEYAYLGVPLVVNSNQPIPFEEAILEGCIDYANGRGKVLLGIEYNPEVIFNLRAPVFVALGLVVNYSFGGVVAHGTFEVANDHTTYYGAALQKFSKLGISVRVGFEK